MANGNAANIKINIPFDPTGLAQVFGQLGGQPQGVGPLRQDLLPQQGFDPDSQVAQLSPASVDAPQEAPPAPAVAPSANLPAPPAPSAPPIAQAAPPGQPPVDPRRQQLQEKLQEQFATAQGNRQNTIEQLQNSLSAQEQQGLDIVGGLSKSLANFSDAFFDTNISKNIKAPETAAERDARLNALRRVISQEQGALSKAEVEALKSALTISDNHRLVASQGRDRRFGESQKKAFEFNFRSRKASIAKEAKKLGLSGLNTVLNNLDAEIPGGLEGFDPTRNNLPGIGGAQAALPLGRLSEQGRRMRQLALSLGNQVLKLRSGAQINEQEATRILGELGIDQAIGEGGGIKLVFKGTRGDIDFIKGVQDAKDAMTAEQDLLRLGFGQDAYDVVSPAFLTNRSRKAKAAAPAKKTISESDLDKMTEAELDAFLKGK